VAEARPDIGIFMGRPDRTFYMARGLRDLGFDVVNYNTEAYGTDPVVRVEGRFLSALRHVLTRTDHAVYFTSLSFIPTLCLYVNRVLRGKPYVFNFTGVKWEMFMDRSRNKPFSGLWERRIYPFLMDRILAGAARIVCNSRFLEDYIAERSPQYRAKLLTIYNGIEFDRYSSGQRTPMPGVNPGDPVVLCVTALNFANKSKGLHLVIDAFEEVLAKRPGVKLVVAAKAGGDRYARDFEAWLRSRRCRDSVIVFYNRKDIPDLLASSDIFAYATPPNSNDSLPRALLEAQSAGLATVTTDTSGCSEIVVDGRTGFTVPYEAEAMADRILTLLDNPQLCRELGKHAQERILERFNWDQMAAGYARVFLEVAQRRGARG
jgi:glycosyltransferase involved in cell wall biosynthesis